MDTLKTLTEIKKDISESSHPLYVYVLHDVDGVPFYVGKGGYKRIEAHEKEARSDKEWAGKNTFKTNKIKKIWRDGGQVFYSIDSWHDDGESANKREIELIAQYGRRMMKEEGTLTNITAGGEGGLDLPQEIRDKLAASLRKMYADHPEKREEISQYNKQYCQDNPEFIENLQDAKNEWIEQKPEEYEAAEKKRLEICSSEEVRKAVSETLKQYYKDNPEVLEQMSERSIEQFASEEAREVARQNSIENKTHLYIINWLETADEEVLLKKWKKHSEWLTGWHQTEEGKRITKEAAIKRNETVRTEEHRAHMANKTAEYIRQNPEADRIRRQKAADAIKKTYALKAEAKKAKLEAMRDELFASGKIKNKPEEVNRNVLQQWERKGLIRKAARNEWELV